MVCWQRCNWHRARSSSGTKVCVSQEVCCDVLQVTGYMVESVMEQYVMEWKLVILMAVQMGEGDAAGE